MAGTIGLVQNDIKRVLAYSTVSQLGYMFLAMGVGAFAAGIFHLYTHAFFKALLFLGSGAVIHALHGEQDLRNMGGLKKHLPITYWTFLIGTLAIAGRAAARRVLLEGRDPLEDVLRAATPCSGCIGGRHGVPDGDLHVPAAVPGVLRRAPRSGARRHDGHGEHAATTHAPARGHGGSAWPRRTCTTRRRRWRFALVVLAIGSVARRLRRRAARARRAATGSRRSSSRASTPVGGAERAAAAAAAARRRSRTPTPTTELALMALSTLVALAGIGLAARSSVDAARSAPTRMAARFGGLHRLLLNKYYVDEIYDAVDRAADQARLDRRCCGAASMPA